MKEAVFSSSEDRIRASRASAAAAGRPIVVRETLSSGPADASTELDSTGHGSTEHCSTEHGSTEPGSTQPGWAGNWARRVSEGLFSVLFPSDCRICGEPQLNISRLPVCPDCVAGIHPVRGKMCSICGERVLSAYAEMDSDGLRRCPVCRRIDRPYGRAVAYGSYEGGLRELIHLLKYNGVRPAAKVLGRMLADAWTALEPEFEQAAFERGMFDQQPIMVIPVPLYKSRRRERGFNQAELIARAALKVHPLRVRLQLAPEILQRTRDTHPQIGLTSHQRRLNLRGAFAVTRAAEVTGRDVILVDDVYTTGTTATECARVLRRAGARRVWVATVARTLKLATQYADIAPDLDEADNLVSEDVLAKAAGS